MPSSLPNNQTLYNILQENENTFRLLTDTIPACVFVIQDNRFSYVNHFFTDLTGYRLSELVDMNFLDLIHPLFQTQVRESITRLFTGPGQIRHDLRIIPKDGSECWLDVSASVFQWDNKPAVLGAAYDITRRIRLQSDLMQSEKSFRQLADTAPSLIFVLSDGRLVYVNKAYTDQTGYTEQDCLHMEPWEFFHPEHHEMVRAMSAARVQGNFPFGRYQTRMVRKNGQEAWTDFSMSEITFNGCPSILGVAMDITQQKQALDEVEYLSYHDKLTGLYNRAYLEDKANNDRSLPLSIIIGDLNGLKMVNDAFGHQVGDLMLQQVARVLATNCGDHGITARWGGDEFIVMLPGSSAENARGICNRIYEDCMQLEDFPVQMSISLGTATRVNLDKSIEKLFKEAEDLMYRHKLLEIRSARSTFINSLEETLRVRSHETLEHTERLHDIVLMVGHSLGLPPDDISSLTLLAALHDIGKIAVPNSILDKPDRLTAEEWEVIKKHPEIGYRIALSDPELAPIAEGILHHHERWDGKGYPLGTRGEEIPLMSRILALADAYDVMTSGRPYRPGISSEAACEEIVACAGSQFDPRLAGLFVELIRIHAG
ncbi:MAG: PAS domain S-box protein [Deltaproteobacteria bacterium]